MNASLPLAVLLVVTGFAAHGARRALAPAELLAPAPVDADVVGAADPAAAVTAGAPASIHAETAATGSTVESHGLGSNASAATAAANGDPQRTGATATAGRSARASVARDPAGADPLVANVLAREALRLVGKDPDALVIWRRAINDPRLPAGDRSDLIEDLNDEGYDEQDAFTQADLELILARLALIEQEMPYAMDDTNAWAFTEAYQDLLGMLVKARADVKKAQAKR